MSRGECFNCKFEYNCPNNLYSKNDLRNNHKRCSINTEYCNTNDKFQPKNQILELTHQKSIDENWYWKCPVCQDLIYPHSAGKGKGHFVLISKGHATKHLMSHNVGYVPKGENITEITSKNQYFCNKCDSPVNSKNLQNKLYVDLNWEPEHKFFCPFCAGYYNFSKGLKTRDEVHKGKL